MSVNHGLILRNGWLQGSVLTISDSTLLLKAAYGERQPPISILADTRLVLVSHSCDVLSPSPLETTCEFCPALPLPSGETLGQFGYGRDPRRLRLPIKIDGQPTVYELYAPLRFYAPRETLERMRPDSVASISEIDLITLETWLAARVRRRAFPNEFDRRLDTKNHKLIRKALSSVNDHVHHLLYSLSPQREILDENERYQIRVLLLAKSKSMHHEIALANLEASRDRIEEILTARPGITATVHLLSDEEFTYAQFRTFSQWGFEDLSLELDEKDCR